MKKLFNILYSTRLMAILFIVFATAMGIATFIENDYGTQTAKALVYNTRWFEAIMVFFVINFFGNIFRYRLTKKEKWPVLMFHLAFLFIIIGAGITRYIGYEGLMLIDEGETTNKFLSETTYVNLVVDNDKEQKIIHRKTLFSAKGKNSWSIEDDFRGKEFSIDLVDYIPWAEKKLVEDENGSEFLFVVESSSGSRHEHYIKKGTLQNIHGILVGFEAPGENASVNIFRQNGNLKIKSKTDGTWMRMADQRQGAVAKDSVQQFQLRSLYNVAGLPFVVPEPVKKGEIRTVRGKKRDDKKLDVLVLDVNVDGQTQQIELAGGQYNSQNSKQLSVNGLNFRLLYGSKILETPFSIKLNDFQLEKYPGSESAAAYASEITVTDQKEVFDYRIYMNHILDHKGYKFFQASYDLSGPVEQTHLSVNHDFWGTLITYIGYSLLYFGMISLLFAPKTRFDQLKKMLKKIEKKKAALVLFFGIFVGASSFAQDHNTHAPARATDQQIDSILEANMIDLKHAETFNKIVIQDAGGRMKPAHTFASELIRKVSYQEDFKGMEPSQVLLSIIENPRLWFDVPFIYLEDGNTKIREDLGLDKDVEYARLSDFITARGEYKIRDAVAEAQKKNVKNKFEKDLIKIDRRVGLLYSAIGGGIFRIFPIPNDENNTWVSMPETSRAPFKGVDSVFVRQAIPVYLQLLQVAKKNGDYTEADKMLVGLKNFQKKYGSEVYPDEGKIDMEIRYNKLSIFNKLSKYYGMISVVMLFFVIFQILYNEEKSKNIKYILGGLAVVFAGLYLSSVIGKWGLIMTIILAILLVLQIVFPKNWLSIIVKFLIGTIILLFVAHIAGLGARWYISGNAPWSNAYESIIYVAFAVMLFGFIIGRKSSLTIAAAAFLTSMFLFFAHQNWLDPEIANLQPVLNSWWLLVHVSIIVASYGPFALGMILGVVALLLTIFTNKDNKARVELNIKEITAINEMALTVGLVMLTIGNFLGGMWANESWGRYWGWDPKETWALISIMIYAFVLHMRLIPGLRSRYTFNLWSIIAFGSIMMTYFGVNFYLSGLHSYASGDQVITPSSVYYSVAFVAVLGFVAWLRHRKFYKS
ncbi:cytochrome c biogenesis protein CcsA [Pseudotenacibaculum haliotis]|uniref:Cytochrome c biogenesis protein CcsA n=1 Tax=Pseudotenacibaculum haliotis TaxID=1862138 RepID=A0ABW5LTG4_9FLAO